MIVLLKQCINKAMRNSTLRLLAGFLVFIFQTSHALALYSDVPATTPYYNSIKTLYELGRLPVETDDKFHPNDQLTKGELYKLVLTYGMADLSKNIKLPYSDIPKNSPYAIYIQTAFDNKLIQASSGKLPFGINAKVSKYNALKTMFEGLGIGTNHFFVKVDFPFKDIDADDDIAPLANKAAQLNILEKATPEKFLRNKKITKAEAVDYLYKIKESNNPTITVTFNKTTNDLSSNKNYPTLVDAWSTLKNKFLYKDKLSDNQLIYGAIKGMVAEAKDKYTVFDSPSEGGDLISKLSSTYEGIGIVIELIEKNITIVTPFKDAPAEKAGLQGKDIITKVDDQSIAGLSLEEVSTKIKGPIKSTVKITINRNGKEMEFNVMRDAITLKRVTSKTYTTTNGKQIGYLSLSDFGDNSDNEFSAAAKELIKENPVGLIFDLRNNPGGYVDTAINIISLFTDEKKTALKMEFVDKRVEEMKTSGNGTLKGYKVIVLINEGSASASEITAGALKDFGIATIIGKKSFGKGVAQEIRQYKDGSLLKYTISTWLTPNGTGINGQGITPDITVEKNTDPKVDDQLNTALAQF